MLRKIGKGLLLIPFILVAAELNFSASVNRTQVGVNEPLTLTVTVQGENIGQVPAPQLPDLPDFTVAGRSSSQSTSIQFINGRLIQQGSITYIYTLYPKKEGTFKIGACTIAFKDETYQTQPISITVVKGTTPSQPQPPSTMTPAEPGMPIDANIKLVASTDKRTVFVGEQIIVEYDLYTRVNIQGAEAEDAPSFSGFWVEPIFEAQRFDFHQKNVDGVLYNVSVLKKSALFPVTSGSVEIPSWGLNVQTIQQSRDFFDFFGRTKTSRISSKPITITVKPLPDVNKPASFAGGVGEFHMNAELDRTVSDAAEPINLTVSITGTGNLRLMEKPAVPSIPGVKILDPEVQDDIQVVNDVVQGTRKFRYPLIPQTDGEHLVPAIEIAYFNPRDKKYYTIRTEQLKFTAQQTAAATALVEEDGLKVLGSDIRFIKPDASRLTAETGPLGWGLTIWYVAALIMIAAAVLYSRHQARLLTDRAYARKTRSSAMVRKRMKEAERHLKKNDEKAFHAVLSKVILGYIGDRYNLDVGALTKEEIVQEMRTRNIQEEHIQIFIQLLDQCDVIRFSPGMTCDNPKDLLEKTKKLLSIL
ncbi:MAG: protein BatD [candidate division WOR-3 bacterium]|nr:MAG: protein BatD [candidate division WOR-3 bacterium]